MTNLKPLTKSEVKEFILNWYENLNNHVSPDELASLVTEQNLEMQFPDTLVQSRDELKNVYGTSIYKFFDESHTINKRSITINEDQADVRIELRWEARQWNPPAAKSEKLTADVVQSFRLKRASATEKPMMVRYKIDSITPVSNTSLDQDN